MSDWMRALAAIGPQVAAFIQLLQAVAGLTGVWLVISGLIELWGIDNPNASKFVSGKNNFSAIGGIVKLLLGGVMISMGTLEMVGILSRTVTDDYATSRFLSYTPQSDSLDEQRLAALTTMLGLLQVIGFAAMYKGWLTINRTVQGQQQAGYGMAFGWLLGGIIAWNFKWFTDMANCSFGFNIIGIFVPYGVQNACH